ncbi:MAG: NAD-dependent epimerase/dehydratase family protein [Candidatus Aminicenantes bacterium]|nr:NAD-dependent epimerase/dehydratase family protein [Candidatus Aminicenantes bacterium]
MSPGDQDSSEAVFAAHWRPRVGKSKRSTSGREATFPPASNFISGDICDAALLEKAVAGTDVVFHLAAALGASRLSPEEFMAVNAGGTRVIMEAARKNSVRRVVHFSSAGVLGHVKPGDVADERYPLDPRDVYDKTKLAGERAALEFAAAGLDVVVIRPGWVYGPGDRRTLKLVRSIARGRFLFPGKGGTLQSPTFIDDLVSGTVLCADRGRAGEIYNIAGKEALTVRQMAETIAAAVEKKLPRFHLPMGPTRAAAWTMGKAFGLVGREAPLNPSRLAFFVHPKALKINKAQVELGFVPGVDFVEGMARTVAWYRAAGWI